MNTTLKIITCFLLLYSFGISCSEEHKPNSNNNNQVRQPINPNGDTELALLMRAMFEDIQEVKKQIAAGDSISLSLDHERILTAHATEPEKAGSKEYKAFANTYLQALKSIKTVSPSQKIEAYKSLVNNCMTCHQALCPGPIVKIKKLL